jgi:hypothetical protein
MKLDDLEKGSAGFPQRADLSGVFIYLPGMLIYLLRMFIYLPGLFLTLPQQKLDRLR